MMSIFIWFLRRVERTRCHMTITVYIDKGGQLAPTQKRCYNRAFRSFAGVPVCNACALVYPRERMEVK